MKNVASYHEVTNAFNFLSDRPESVTNECMNILEIHRSPLQPNMSENESQRDTKDFVHTKGKNS